MFTIQLGLNIIMLFESLKSDLYFLYFSARNVDSLVPLKTKSLGLIITSTDLFPGMQSIYLFIGLFLPHRITESLSVMLIKG